MRNRIASLLLAVVICAGMLSVSTPPAHAVEVGWQKSFGGGGDQFSAVAAVPDGVVAVGQSSQESFGKGDWEGVASHDTVAWYSDAIIVKFDNSGNVLWKHNIGGDGNDCFTAIAAVPGGVIAVGWSSALGTGDWSDIPRKTDYINSTEPIMVKLDSSGKVLWKKTFGSTSGGEFYGIAAMDDGFVAVGSAYGIGTGDWVGLESYAGVGDATIVKFDFNGNVVWKNIFGGYAYNGFTAVTVTPDGIVCVGEAYQGAFGTGDWEGVRSKTTDDNDAIVAVFKPDGKLSWCMNYGGRAQNEFYGVTPITDGFVAVGMTEKLGPFDTNHGSIKGVVAEYSFYQGFVGETLMGAEEAGATEINNFNAIATLPDGYVVAGYANAYGSRDNVALAIKFNQNNQAQWTQYYASRRAPYDYELTGTDADPDHIVNGSAEYHGVAAVPGGIVAVGSVTVYYVGMYAFITMYEDVAATVADAPTGWAKPFVGYSIAQGLVPQALQSKYTQATTRAEFCALAVSLYESIGSEIVERSTFTDTSDVNVEKAAAIGVVTGVGGGRFDPDAKLTREQAAVMLSRLSEAFGKPLDSSAPTFADNSKLSDWAYDAVGQMQLSGVMTGVGDNRFDPASDYTREQSIVTIFRMFELLK